MGNSMIEQAIKLFREKRKYRYWLAAFLCLAVLVTLGTVTVLKMNGQAANHKQKLLDCQIELHQHTEGCYDSEGGVICGYADYAVHTHNDDCYDSEGTLVCQLPEVQAHTHSPECYQEKEELVCGQEESEGHVHTEECYTLEQGALICGQEEFYIDETGAEQEAHVHTDNCYEWTETLSCGQEEGQGGHTHTESCYETKTELACGEQELHTHDETCYDQDGRLACGLLELKEHVHGEECFETIELTKEEIETLNSAENPEKTEEAEKTVKTFEDETVKVTAEYGEFANIPEEAELVVKQITEESDPEHFAERREEFQNQMGSEQASMDVLMDIGFYLDGEEIEPDDTVTVKIKFADGKEVSEAGSVNMVHFADDGTEVLEDSSVDDDGVITFEMDSFSEVALFAAGNLGINLQSESRNSDTEDIHFYCIYDYENTGNKTCREISIKKESDVPLFDSSEIPAEVGIGKFYFFQENAILEDIYKNPKYDIDMLMTMVNNGSGPAWIGYSTDNNKHITVKKYYSNVLLGGWKLCASDTGEKITGIYFLPGNETEYENIALTDIAKVEDSSLSSPYTVTFNPRNANAENVCRWEYSGNSNESGRLEVPISRSMVSENKAEIILPDYEALDTTFHFDKCGEDECISKKKILGQDKSVAYQYELVGWYNIAKKKKGNEKAGYYSVKDGPVSVEVDFSENNVFYADWVAKEDNFQQENPNTDERELAVYTDDFVTTKMFDYNDLFNIYSSDIRSSTLGISEDVWQVNSNFSNLQGIAGFHFLDGGENGTLKFPNGGAAANSSQNDHPTQNKWVTDGNQKLLEYLFDESGESLGVHYLGTGSYLYMLGTTGKEKGYYYYDSEKNGASYNPVQNRFYISEATDKITAGGNKSHDGFFPLNKPLAAYTETNTSDGQLNYHFGMSSEVSFYLPAAVGSESEKTNQYEGTDTVFEFSGDDDVWVFVDGKLILDMGGIHGKVNGSINFSNGDCNIHSAKDPDTNFIQDSSDGASYIKNLPKGPHTLKIYYLERGGNESNCKIKFNIVPRYKIETPTANTVKVEKKWENTEESLRTSINVGLKRFYIENGKEICDSGFQKSALLNGDNGWSYIWEGLDSYRDPVSKQIPYIYKVDENDVPEGFEKKVVDKVDANAGNSWVPVDTSKESEDELNGQEILFIDRGNNKALGTTGDTITAVDVECASNGVLLSKHATDSVKWILKASGKKGYKLNKKDTEYFLNIEDGDNGKPQLTDESAASVFTPDDAIAGGFSTEKYRIIYERGGFIIAPSDIADVKDKLVWSYLLKETIKVTNSTITNTRLANISIVKTDNEGQHLSGAEFQLCKEDNEKNLYYDIQNKTWTEETKSIVMGTLSLPDFPDGNYRLKEIKEPSGYQIIEDFIVFKVTGARITEAGIVKNTTSDSDQIVTDSRIVKSEDGLTIYIKNEPIPVEKRMVRLIKVDSNGTNSNPLSGAVFSLYQEAEKDDFKTEKLEFQEEQISVVKIRENLQSVETGIFYEDELPVGVYYLSESTAPNGYNKLSEPVKIAVQESGVSVENPNEKQTGAITVIPEQMSSDSTKGNLYEIKIPNSTGYKLPHTGGSGTYPFAIGSAVLFSTAAFLLYGYSIRQKRRQKRLHR